MKYKVGDKVKVRSDLELYKVYGTDSFTSRMEEMKGKTVTIAHVSEDKYSIKEFGYGWTDEMFEGLVKEDKTMYASELMELARKEPAKYEGKRYKVVGGTAITHSGEDIENVTLVLGGFADRNYRLYVSDNTELEKIPQPVSFMEAVKAYSEGETVECKTIPYGTEKYIPSERSLDDVLRSSGGHIRVKEILHGEWFIK